MHFLTYFLVPQLVSALAISQRDDRNRAAYFLDSNPNGASIVSLKINLQDGTLSDPIRIPTGGKGLQGLTASATPGGAPAPGGGDPFFSQDSVLVSEDYLFTVNSGSNTVSMFLIDKTNPWTPTLINTAPSLGEFPVSVAYSSKLKTACVLNGGAIAGVACFSTDHKTGLTPLGSLRPLPLNQTTPPVGPPGTASDIVFSPSSNFLLITIKAGLIYVYPTTSSNLVSTTPIISSPTELVVDFSVSFLGSDTRALITDPSYGASIVTISPSFAVTVEKKIPVPNEGAICWSTFSSRFNSVFLMDAGHSNITIVDPATGAIKGVLAESVAGMGSLDSAVDRQFLYSLKASASVSVGDLTGLDGKGGVGKEVQSLDLSALGSRATWIGMAVYPSS